MTVKQIICRKRYDCSDLIGKFLGPETYDETIDYDCDVHYISGIDDVPSEENIVLKFRKNYFTVEQQTGALEGLRGAAQQSENRGNAAGPKIDKLHTRDWVSEEQLDILEYMAKPYDTLDGTNPIDNIIEMYKSGMKGDPDSKRGSVWLMSKVGKEFDFYKWAREKQAEGKDAMSAAAKIALKEWVSVTSYATPVISGVAGSFTRYPRIPFARLTSYSEKNWETYQKSFPFLQQLGQAFADLLPQRYKTQMEFVSKIDPKFVVPGTPFTTLTVNQTFRTAAHLDAGDLASGFSNLCVLTNGKKYSGGDLILPELRVAVAIRPGDLLLVGNHDWIHGNTPIVLEEEGAQRYSLVAYVREEFSECGSYEYECLRREFVEQRANNKDHELWRPRWNGTSVGWEQSEEWRDYLIAKGREDFLKQYHPDLVDSFKKVSLDSFF